MVDLWCYNQPNMTELLIMRNHHYDRMGFKSECMQYVEVIYVYTASKIDLAIYHVISCCYIMNIAIHTTR